MCSLTTLLADVLARALASFIASSAGGEGSNSMPSAGGGGGMGSGGVMGTALKRLDQVACILTDIV